MHLTRFLCGMVGKITGLYKCFKDITVLRCPTHLKIHFTKKKMRQGSLRFFEKTVNMSFGNAFLFNV